MLHRPIGKSSLFNLPTITDEVKYWSMFSWGGENTNGTYLGSFFRIIVCLVIKFSLLNCDNIFF